MIDRRSYPETQRFHVFVFLMLAGGFLGAYSYILKGHVFANAQTANCMLVGINIASGEYREAARLLVPIFSYFLGAVVSEAFIEHFKDKGFAIWETILLVFNILASTALGLIPYDSPHVVYHVVITFICAMQFNTFRKAEGVVMATLFCTAHLRESGVKLVKFIRERNEDDKTLFLHHTAMIFTFILGVFLSTIAISILNEKAIFLVNIFYLYVLIDLIATRKRSKVGKLSRATA